MALRIQAALVATAILAGVLVLTVLTPQQLDQLPKSCLWSMLLGRPCPACGTLHALSALLHGDPIGAWNFNPNVVVTTPVIVWILLLQVRLLFRGPRPVAKPASSLPSVS